MAGYGSPRWSGKGPMAVNPTDTASCHGMPGTHRHHHKPGVAGERPHLGKATGPPQPEAHPEDPGSSFGHNTVSLPRLAPAQSLQSSSSCSWIPPNPAAPPVPWPKCPKICWQHHPGSRWALVWGGRAGTDSERGTLPPFSPAPIPEWAWAAWSLPTPQLSGSTSNLGRDGSSISWTPAAMAWPVGMVGSGSARRVKCGRRTGSITSARLRL